jgi:hypothetical protein
MHQEQSVENIEIRLRDAYAPAAEHAEPPAGAQMAPGGFWAEMAKFRAFLDLIKPYLALIPPGKYQKALQGLMLIFDAIQGVDVPSPVPAAAPAAPKPAAK